MDRWIKRSSLWRGKWWFRAGVLCCALLIPLSISTNVLRAAPLTRVSPPGDLSDAWKHKWLAGVMTSTVSPPEGLSKTQELEWSIGTIAASAELCGYYGKVSKVEAFMKKSIYFKRGYNDVMNFYDFAQNCSRYVAGLDTVLGEKEEWENYLGITYPDGAALPESPQARTFNGRNDENICERALSSDRETPNWDNKTIWREYVNEAKRRDLTPHRCAKLLGWNTVSSEKKPPEDGDVEKRLTKLKNLFEKGLITKDEYDKKRGKILEAL